MEPAERIRQILEQPGTRDGGRPEDLGRLYQEQLEDPAPSGVLSRARHRKAGGVFYTDRTLSEATVEHTLQLLLHEGGDPGAILELRVCDPAMGCGAFLLATLRCLSRALARGLLRYGWPGRRRDLPPWWGELLEHGPPPETPGDLAGWPVLRRLVARRCLFGVDLDPAAVELARTALCLEVGDRSLPEGFLAQNLRRGDALIGARRRQLESYPVEAWSRKGGDHTHRQGVHFRRGQWSQAIDRRRRELAEYTGTTCSSTLPERVRMDLWCALWFWPADRIRAAPSPRRLAQPDPEVLRIAEEIAAERHFLHWELEFPEVFGRERPGFDAVVGNPPWEILKPDSKAFFGERDPLYGTYGKQRALEVQRSLFEASPATEEAWLRSCAHFQDLCNWIGRGRRADDGARFRFQGRGDPNAYKLFLELAHELARDRGALGMGVPSGLYTDLGCKELRRLFLDRCRWRWLYGFENRRRIFPIDNRFKFAPIVVQKGGRTGTIRAAFLRRHPEEWKRPGIHCLPLRREQVLAFSPRTRTILEIVHRRDLEILEKICASCVPLGAPSWGIRQARELDMTNDSHLFPTRSQWESRGFRADRRGCWVHGSRGSIQRAHPLIEGRMVGAYRFNQKGWVSGKGRRALWRSLPVGSEDLEPQYLVAEEDLDRVPGGREVKLGFMAISSATNTRSMIATAIPGLPCGNAVPILRTPHGLPGLLALLGVLNSTVFDYALRLRLGGVNLNLFVLEECPVPEPDAVLAQKELLDHCANLAWGHPLFADAWREMGRTPAGQCVGEGRTYRRAVVDAAVAALYGLDPEDLAWILRDCEHPVERLRDRGFLAGLDPKGFWRVDRRAEPEQRLTVMTSELFAELMTRVGSCRGDRQGALRRFCAGRP